MVVFEEYGSGLRTPCRTRTGRKGVRTCSNRRNHPPGRKPLAASTMAQRYGPAVDGMVQSTSIATTASKWVSVKGRSWALPARRSTSMPLSPFTLTSEPVFRRAGDGSRFPPSHPIGEVRRPSQRTPLALLAILRAAASRSAYPLRIRPYSISGAIRVKTPYMVKLSASVRTP